MRDIAGKRGSAVASDARCDNKAVAGAFVLTDQTVDCLGDLGPLIGLNNFVQTV